MGRGPLDRAVEVADPVRSLDGFLPKKPDRRVAQEAFMLLPAIGTALMGPAKSLATLSARPDDEVCRFAGSRLQRAIISVRHNRRGHHIAVAALRLQISRTGDPVRFCKRTMRLACKRYLCRVNEAATVRPGSTLLTVVQRAGGDGSLFFTLSLRDPSLFPIEV